MRRGGVQDGPFPPFSHPDSLSLRLRAVDKQRELERMFKEADARGRAANYSNRKMAMQLSSLQEAASKEKSRARAAAEVG